jgi:signal transduction histidine kinase
MSELESTLRLLRVILIGVAIVSSVAGAGLGYFTARRALAPVPRISNAARRIAAGDFTTRLDLQVDRDLAVLSTAFNDMVDAVKLRLEREQRFTTDVSHELRSPLTTLAASVEVLQRRQDSLPRTAQQAVELLSEDLSRFQRLVEDLLEISRMEAGAAQLELSRFKLAEFLENAIAQSRSPEIMLQCPDEVAEVPIVADKRRLFQIMTNLINNAAKYAEGATGISFEVVDEQVQIVVDDAGPGVPATERDRIFERFGRIGSEAGNRASGTGFGLGLSLVAEHVRLHNGEVWVTDRIDGQRGARFVVKLPLVAEGDQLGIIEEEHHGEPDADSDADVVADR